MTERETKKESERRDRKSEGARKSKRATERVDAKVRDDIYMIILKPLHLDTH